MFIKSVILDGFKSYGKRTEIHGFDPEFTAITGLNGTGKSNVLDSICFVLGISNLTHVRATSLQELVYKSGQAGVKKATVTIVFDNTDPEQCPIGYEKCREISVTRQVIVRGKNKYFINGKTVLNKKVSDLFCSVKLNVNNPNFLIMQGRITKVLNMKPNEILSMIEEAAGTSMYETKRDQTNKVIGDKDLKLKEIDSLLTEEILPKLEKLRAERSQYMEFQKIVRDIEYLTRIFISYKYLQYKKSMENCEQTLVSISQFITDSKNQIQSNEEESIELSENMVQIQQHIDTESGGQLKEIEAELATTSKEEAQAVGAKKSAITGLETEKKRLKSLQKSINDDEQFLTSKRAEMSKGESLFENLKQAAENDTKAYQDSVKHFEALSSGLATTNEKGEATSLQDELIKCKQQLSEANTVVKKSEMELKYTTNQLKTKEHAIQTNDTAYVGYKKSADEYRANIQNLEQKLAKMNFDEETLNQLIQEKEDLEQQRRNLKRQIDCKNGYKFDFQYTDPEQNFDRRRVKGRVCNLFDVKNQRDCLALSICGGGSLYNVVTDTDVTSKIILQKGQLKSRTTMIPINKVNAQSIPPNVIKLAEDLVGKENVMPALSLISYEPDVDKVMKFVFGRVFVCKDINIAKKVTYDKRILYRSVTLDGDVVDPEGTLSGGSAPKGAPLLIEVAEIKQLTRQFNAVEHQLKSIIGKIAELQTTAQIYSKHKEQLELVQHQLKTVQMRLQETSFQQNQQEIEELKQKIESLKAAITEATEIHESSKQKIRELEAQIADSKGNRDRIVKAAMDEMKNLKKTYEESKKNWKQKEQSYETLCLEIEELEKGIANDKKQFDDLSTNISNLQEQLQELTENYEKHSERVTELKSKLKQQKDIINSQNKELKQLNLRKEKLLKQNQDLQLDIKKKENDRSKLQSENKEGFDTINKLENKYKWIQEDKEYFGVKNTRYDYSKEDPKDSEKKLNNAKVQKEKMEKHINLKAMMLLDREEEQYEEVQKRKVVVLEDKEKIQKIIKDLDEKRKVELKNAWQSVNENFGNIFSTLLPGAQAQLVPPNGKNFLLGLTVRVGFNGLWKESLNELSGGQRSLVALSLILAMLKFNPAPIYILDEVDAALDMSHTQNIGNMLKAHFKNSQFVIVSLKDGMFNNANVLFKTKFEDGVSGITRTVNIRSQK